MTGGEKPVLTDEMVPVISQVLLRTAAVESNLTIWRLNWRTRPLNPIAKSKIAKSPNRQINSGDNPAARNIWARALLQARHVPLNP